MSDSPIGQNAPDDQPIPVTRYNTKIARKAWDDFKSLCEQEADIRARRKEAHKRFLAAFTAGDE